MPHFLGSEKVPKDGDSGPYKFINSGSIFNIYSKNPISNYSVNGIRTHHESVEIPHLNNNNNNHLQVTSYYLHGTP